MPRGELASHLILLSTCEKCLALLPFACHGVCGPIGGQRPGDGWKRCERHAAVRAGNAASERIKMTHGFV